MPQALLWIIRGGLFIVPFIPLYISKVLFFPYITGKAFVFRIIVEIVFAAWLFLAFYYKEYRPKKTPLLIALAVFIAVVALATIFGVNPAKSFWSNYERMEGLAAYLHFFAYFLVLTNVFKKSDWKIFFNLFVAAGIYENVYVLLQRLGYLLSPQGGVRTDGTIGNPTYLEAYLIFILGFCLWLLINTDNKAAKYFYGMAGLFTAMSIYFTASRGPTLALLIGSIAATLIYLYLKPPVTIYGWSVKKMAAAFLVLLILIPGGLWLLRDNPLVKSSPSLNRLTSLSFKERTIMSRFTIWSMSWEGFKERPILGWGPGNYDLVFSKYFKPELWRQEPWFDRSHNIIFDWLINAGFLGLLSYFGIWVSTIYLLWRHFKNRYWSLENSLLIFTILLVYLAQNFFVFDQIATYICFFAVLAYINSFSVQEIKETAVAPVSRGQSDWPVIAVVLLVPLVLIMYVINIRPLQVNLNLLGGLATANNVPLAFEKFIKALSYNTLGKEEVREQLIRFSLSAGASPELSPDFRDKILRRAIEEAQKGVVENPMDPRAHLFLGTIYQKVGLSDQAISVFNKAMELSPQKQQIYFEIADIYFQRGDFRSAIELLKTALELDPSYDQARLNLAVAYILNGRQPEADEVLISGFGTVEVPSPILVTIYSRVKDYNRLVGIWKVIAKNTPQDLNYRKSLAGAHLLANQKPEAIKALEQVIKDFPEFKAEGENLIKDIKN